MGKQGMSRPKGKHGVKMQKKQLPGPKPLEAGVDGKGKNVNKSLAAVKREIRSLERLLKREGLPPEIREAKEAQLAALQGKKVDRIDDIKSNKYEKKYKHIRFFEQRKVERRIHKLEKQLAEGESPSNEQESQLEALKEDLQYVINFPKSEKYISLFIPPAEGTEEQTEAKRAAIRLRIKAELEAKSHEAAEMEVVTELNEGRSVKSEKAVAEEALRKLNKKLKVENVPKSSSKRNARSAQPEEANDEVSDYSEDEFDRGIADSDLETEDEEEDSDGDAERERSDQEDSDLDDHEEEEGEDRVIEDPFFLEGANDSDDDQDENEELNKTPENPTARHNGSKPSWSAGGKFDGGRGNRGGRGRGDQTRPFRGGRGGRGRGGVLRRDFEHKKKPSQANAGDAAVHYRGGGDFQPRGGGHQGGRGRGGGDFRGRGGSFGGRGGSFGGRGGETGGGRGRGGGYGATQSPHGFKKPEFSKSGGGGGGGGGKFGGDKQGPPAGQSEAASTPGRTRAEGGRKRKKKQ